MEVTGVTRVGSGNVGRRFTGRRAAVVTTDTSADHLIVIHCGGSDRLPRCFGTVTRLTLIRRVDVRGVLTAGVGAIMTFDTRLAANAAVVKSAGEPV